MAENMMDDSVSKRKMEHIETLLADKGADRRKGYFKDILLKHHALPEIALADVDTSVEFLGKSLSMPFLISSMTGGSGDTLSRINRNLAVAAERAGVAMGVGSQRVMFREKTARRSFELREQAPRTVLLANLGAVQLNCGFGVAECREAVEILDADGLIFHLNPLQEVCQREGDTNFAGLAEKIGTVAAELDVPVLVKEVGAGICGEDVERLLRNGVEIIDVAGTGGVSWSRVECSRSSAEERERKLYEDWGIPTPRALRLMQPYLERIDLIASGGLRSGLDMAKAMAMGAHMCGMARPLLEPAMDSAEAVVSVIERVREEFRKALFLLGCPTVEALKGREDLILTQ